MKKLICAFFCIGLLSSSRADLMYYTFTGEATESDQQGQPWSDIDVVGLPVSYTFGIDLDRQGYKVNYQVENPVYNSFYAEFADNVWFSGIGSFDLPVDDIDWQSYHYGTAQEIITGTWTQMVCLTADDVISSWELGCGASVWQSAADCAITLTSHVNLTRINSTISIPEPDTINLLAFSCVGLVCLTMLSGTYRCRLLFQR